MLNVVQVDSNTTTKFSFKIPRQLENSESAISYKTPISES